MKEFVEKNINTLIALSPTRVEERERREERGERGEREEGCWSMRSPQKNDFTLEL